MILNVLASIDYNIASLDRKKISPFRLVVPEFLPPSPETAVMMVNDLQEESYCDTAWVMDGEPWGGTSEMVWRALLNNIDWSKAETLEYDWTELDHWGNPMHDPWRMWQHAGVGSRSKEIENFIFKDDYKVEAYAKAQTSEAWADWTPEELMRSPCWMFYYAKNVCRGRLPELLDNAMTMMSFERSDDPWIKRYFTTKRYRKRNRKALKSISWAA